MDLIRSIKKTAVSILHGIALAQTLRCRYNAHSLPGNQESWPESLQNPTDYYKNCVRYFHQGAPSYLKHHRRYFTEHQRGFGEDAFHVMWHALLANGKPRSFLEIGVFRGQTLSLASLCAQRSGFPCLVCGISPFSSSGDSVSSYSDRVDYWEDTLKNFSHFGLPKPELVRGLSTDPGVWDIVGQQRWEVIYIDGNHDYEIAKSDVLHASKNLSLGGTMVLDDSGLYTSYQAPPFASRGHPGPSRLANEMGALGFVEVLQVGHNRIFRKKL